MRHLDPVVAVGVVVVEVDLAFDLAFALALAGGHYHRVAAGRLPHRRSVTVVDNLQERFDRDVVDSPCSDHRLCNNIAH